MKLLYAFFIFFLVSSLSLAQVRTPAKSTPKEAKTAESKAKTKKVIVSPTLSRSIVSSSVVATSINSTPAGSTTIVSTTAMSKTTATSAVSRAAGDTNRAIDPASKNNEVVGDASDLTQPGTARRRSFSSNPSKADSAPATEAVVGRRLIPAQIVAGAANGVSDACKVVANDALLVYNLCADGPCGGTNTSALQLRIPNRVKRNGKPKLNCHGKPKGQRRWQYVRASDNVRMNIVSINPSSCTVTLSTAGFQNEFIVDKSPIGPFTLTPAASTTPTADDKKESNAFLDEDSAVAALVKAVTINQQTITEYTAALQEERRILAARPCISNEEIVSKRDGMLAGETITRQQLQADQHKRISELSDAQAELKKTAKEGLTALQAELDLWSILLANTLIRGPVMQARDNDFIQFTIKRRCGTGAEEILPKINIPVYGNFRLNVSTGFLVNGLIDYKYLAIDRGVVEAGFPTSTTITGSGSTTAITESAIVNAPISSTSTTTKVPVRDITSGANIGIGALLHAYYTCPWAKGTLTPALTLGASLNAAGRYTLLFGGSLIMGSTQRIVFTGGYALGPVARLQQPFTTETRQEIATKDNMQTTRTITTAYEFSGAEFPTTVQTKGSWFLAITFNMSSKRNPTPAN